MDTKTKLRKPASPAPRGLRTMLVCLLILSAVSGYAVNAYLFFRAGADLQSGLNIPFADLSGQKFSGDFSRPDTTPSDRPPRTDGSRLERVQTLLQKTAGMNSGAISLTFNGSMTGKNGTLAMINKKAVPVGSEIQGVRVIAIGGQSVTLEYQGETKELGVGQTVSIDPR